MISQADIIIVKNVKYTIFIIKLSGGIIMEQIKVQVSYQETGEDTTTYGREFDESKFGKSEK